MRRRHPAMSLLELSVAMAIAGIIAAAAISLVGFMLSSGRRIGRGLDLTSSGRLGSLFVIDELRIAGGGGVEAWSSLIVEDDCVARGGYPACRGSDRVTVVQTIPRFPSCAIVDTTAPGRVTVETINLSGVDVCCLNEVDFVRQVALVWTDTMQPAVLSGVGTGCEFTVAPVVPGDLLPRQLSASTGFAAAGIKGAVVVLADIKTFYVDWNTAGTVGALRMHVELDGAPSLVGERLTVLDDVADFQVALGYRGAGSLVEASAGTDGWWPNGPGERGRPDPAVFAADGAVVVGASVIVAIPDVGRIGSAETPWGPTRVVPDHQLGAATERSRIGGL